MLETEGRVCPHPQPAGWLFRVTDSVARRRGAESREGGKAFQADIYLRLSTQQVSGDPNRDRHDNYTLASGFLLRTEH